MYLSELGNNSEKEKLSIDPKKAEELVASFKFQFLSIVNDHANYVQLNLPFNYDDDLSLPSLNKKHPLALILLSEVVETLTLGNPPAAAWVCVVVVVVGPAARSLYSLSLSLSLSLSHSLSLSRMTITGNRYPV